MRLKLVFIYIELKSDKNNRNKKEALLVECVRVAKLVQFLFAHSVSSLKPSLIEFQGFLLLELIKIDNLHNF